MFGTKKPKIVEHIKVVYILLDNFSIFLFNVLYMIADAEIGAPIWQRSEHAQIVFFH